MELAKWHLVCRKPVARNLSPIFARPTCFIANFGTSMQPLLRSKKIFSEEELQKLRVAGRMMQPPYWITGRVKIQIPEGLTCAEEVQGQPTSFPMSGAISCVNGCVGCTNTRPHTAPTQQKTAAAPRGATKVALSSPKIKPPRTTLHCWHGFPEVRESGRYSYRPRLVRRPALSRHLISFSCC